MKSVTCACCRGAALEMLLSKLVASRGQCSVQIVAMSATMSGLDSLSTWLDAHLFLTNFRQVPPPLLASGRLSVRGL